MWEDLRPIFAEYDALLTPTCAQPPPPNDTLDPDYYRVDEQGRFCGLYMTYPFNFLHQCPALAVPSGVTKSGLPTSLQIVGQTPRRQRRPANRSRAGGVPSVGGPYASDLGAWGEQQNRDRHPRTDGLCRRSRIRRSRRLRAAGRAGPVCRRSRLACAGWHRRRGQGAAQSRWPGRVRRRSLHPETGRSGPRQQAALLRLWQPRQQAGGAVFQRCAGLQRSGDTRARRQRLSVPPRLYGGVGRLAGRPPAGRWPHDLDPARRNRRRRAAHRPGAVRVHRRSGRPDHAAAERLGLHPEPPHGLTRFLRKRG